MSAERLVTRLGLEGDLPHLEEALTHPSFSNEQPGRSYRSPAAPPPGTPPSGRQRGRRGDNQRLEFLGDAVLGLCVSELLMERYPDADEGELSLVRASLVNTEALAGWAKEVDVGSALRLGRGADAAGERDQKNVLADAVEALVAAVYLDRGLPAARQLSQAIVEAPLSRAAAPGGLGRDPKSQLQEQVQAAGQSSPRYRVVGTEGPDHAPQFLVEVEVDGRVLGAGRGRSKKLAEQAAAQAAIALFAGLPPPPVTSLPNEGEPSAHPRDTLPDSAPRRFDLPSLTPHVGGGTLDPAARDDGTSPSKDPGERS